LAQGIKKGEGTWGYCLEKKLTGVRVAVVGIFHLELNFADPLLFATLPSEGDLEYGIRAEGDPLHPMKKTGNITKIFTS